VTLPHPLPVPRFPNPASLVRDADGVLPTLPRWRVVRSSAMAPPIGYGVLTGLLLAVVLAFVEAPSMPAAYDPGTSGSIQATAAPRASAQVPATVPSPPRPPVVSVEDLPHAAVGVEDLPQAPPALAPRKP
jgi:hypothetical protein